MISGFGKRRKDMADKNPKHPLKKKKDKVKSKKKNIYE